MTWITRCGCGALLVAYPGELSADAVEALRAHLAESPSAQKIAGPVHVLSASPGQPCRCPDCGRDHAPPSDADLASGSRWSGPPFRRAEPPRSQ